MRLDVPFLPDPEYEALLEALGEQVRSAHFGLGDPAIADARHVGGQPGDAERLAAGLRRFRARGRRAYALLNGTFHTPGAYTAASLAHVDDALRHLLDADAVDGIVFADGFLLRSFADAHPDTAQRLEAVPSVNCDLAMPGALHAMLALIDATGFKRPTRLVPARELNRNMDGLHAFAAAARAELPGVSIALLANEGCLPHCPFRSAHGAHIALQREGVHSAASNFAEVRDLGCLRTSAKEPHRLLTSPFIRPEDAHLYEDTADALKVCGRTRGPATLAAIVRAYADGAYHGNLLNLLDAAEPLAPVLHVDNDALTRLNFGPRTSRCALACASCERCRQLAEKAVYWKESFLGEPVTFQNRT